MAAVTQNTHPENSNNRRRQSSAAVSTYSKSQQRRELKISAIFLNFMAPKAFLARLRTGNDSPKSTTKILHFKFRAP